MAVLIERFHTNGRVAVQHDDHTGSLLLADIPFDGAGCIVTCPVCGAATVHPVQGGADPRMVQLLMLRLRVRAGTPFADAKAQLVAQIEATDGPARVQVRDVADASELTSIARENDLLALRAAKRAAEVRAREAT